MPKNDARRISMWLGDDTPPGTDDGPQDGNNDGNTGDDLAAKLEQERKRAAGLDRRVAQLQEQLKATTQEKTTLQEQLETTQSNVGEVTSQLEELQERAQQQAAELSEFQEAAQAASAEAQRAKVVATKYPQLAPLLDAGGLPEFGGEIEEYEQKLGGIVEALNLQSTPQPSNSVDDSGQGKPPASPGASGSAGTQDADAIWSDYMAAVKEGSDQQLIAELKDQYYAALDQ